MGLFPKWQGEIRLPPFAERRVKVGGNSVIQIPFEGMPTRAEISDSDIKGHDLIVTQLQPPYRELLLRHKGAHRVNTNMAVLVCPSMTDANQFSDLLDLEWDVLGDLASFAGTPDLVREAWVDQFAFRTEQIDADRPGLRLPQVGALHAISAHFAVGSEFEPATVVLPTGTGKTETMLATLVYRRLSRVLVIVPSDALRSQIAGKFISLGKLSEAGVIPRELPRPRVAVITTGIRSAAEASELLAEANVIVALPNVLASSSADAVAVLTEGCSDLIVDEAHHITATTWQTVRQLFAKKRILQFTATPFRRDTKRVDGKIIFNYRLGDAQAAGYYRSINLKTIEEYGDDAARDQAIAKEAVTTLRHDRNDMGLDHLLMARTETKERAEAVTKIYEKLAPEMKPVLIFSGPGRAAANRAGFASLLDRGPHGARIVVCVDMLGEGFDLPNLKVAALHDTHKSLAITLQFIGRFTRTGDEAKIGEATVVANIADPRATEKLSELYAEGADWDLLIRRLSEGRIDQELRLQDVVEELRTNGNLHENLSLWNLKPSLSAQLFRTKSDAWDPLKYRSVLPRNAETWHALNEKERVLVVVVCRSAKIDWGNYQNINDTIYDLLIARWDKAEGALCLFASNYDALRSETLAKAITDDRTEVLSGTPIFQILDNVEMPLAKSLGTSRIGAISFTSYFGPNVTEGLASIDKAEASLNNLACLGYENGDRVLWGGTQRRGKVWQQKSGSISDWIDWTKATWRKVTAKVDLDANNILRDFLRPQRLFEPHTSPPISVQWGEQAQMRFHDHQFVAFDGLEVPLYAADAQLDSVGAVGPVLVSVSCEMATSQYRLVIDRALPGGYRHEHVSGPAITFRYGSAPGIPLEEYLQRDPLIVRYADGTYSYNCYHIPVKLNPGLYDRSKLEVWDWTDIPLNKESMHKQADQKTIQYRTFLNLKDGFDVIFNDDGHGEAADLVCLKDVNEDTIQLCLVHIKGAYGGKVSQDIRNFYVVCGQAQKSIPAKHAGLPTLYHDLKRREATWTQGGKTRFLKGNMKDLAYFKDKSRRVHLNFEMVLVQPGASATKITDDALRLLGTTELYLAKTTHARFRVITSA